MKINKLWIPMVIFGIIGGAAKLCDTIFNINGIGFFVNSEICSAIFVISIVLVWLIGVILLIADHKVDVELTPPKSKVTGFFGFISAVSMLGTGVLSIFSLGSSDFFMLSLIFCLMSLAGGGIMLYESCISFTGHNGMNKIPLAGLLVPAWACLRLISLFFEYSKVSIHATEMFDVISVAFLVLFLFYQAMFFAEIGPRAAVRRSTLYGICYIMCGLITTVDIMVKMFSPTPDTAGIDTLVVEPTIGRIVNCVGDLSFVLYAASFIISNARNAVIERFEPDEYEDDDPEFLGQISSEKAPKKKPDSQKTSSKKKGGAESNDKGDTPKNVRSVSYSGPKLKFEDDDSIDFSNLHKAMKDINSESESKLKDDDEPSGIGLLKFDDNAADSDDMVSAPAQDNELEMLSFENDNNFKPAPMTFESVSSVLEPKESEPEPQEEEVETPSYTENYEINQSSFEEDEEDDDIFADENDQEDYDEIFRLLDEMDTDE